MDMTDREIEEIKNQIYLKKLRKQTRKNHKKWIRRKYKLLKDFTEHTIMNAHKRECSIEFKEDYRFITWLIQKKLERKGFECLLLEDFCGSFNDVLEIKW